LHVEPIFYRGCYYHARKAEELIVNIKNENDFVHSLDEIYQERATAIVLAASCFEAFINGLGFDNYPDKWKKIERSNLERKCIEYYSLSGKDPSLFDSDKEPFKKLMTLFEYRNNLVHFKRLYKKSEEINHKYITDTENQLPREFVRDLPENLRKCIIEICNVKSTPIPEWVTPHSNLGWMK